eukprot:m.62399 g.62399  ORF g.62399 m.62399 type:complete len:354 (+) comp13932_c1_seq1:273-1334(+)
MSSPYGSLSLSWSTEDDCLRETEALSTSMCGFLEQEDTADLWPWPATDASAWCLTALHDAAPTTTPAIPCPRVAPPSPNNLETTSSSPSLSATPPSNRAHQLLAEDPPERHTDQHCHIFVDNGNTFVGAQSMANGVMDLAIRVQVKELAQVLEQGYTCRTMEVAASRPSNPRICTAWRKAGYRVYNDLDGVTARQRVGKHLRYLLDTTSVPETIIIASGDGSVFAPLASLAVQRGWRIVVISWSRCLSDRFKRLRLQHPKRVELKFLDEHRHRVTFRAAERGAGALPRVPTKPRSGSLSPPETRQKQRSRRGARQPRRSDQPQPAPATTNNSLLPAPLQHIVRVPASHLAQRC